MCFRLLMTTGGWPGRKLDDPIFPEISLRVRPQPQEAVAILSMDLLPPLAASENEMDTRTQHLELRIVALESTVAALLAEIRADPKPGRRDRYKAIIEAAANRMKDMVGTRGPQLLERLSAISGVMAGDLERGALPDTRLDASKT
jgi:hypothetical protein